MTEDRLAATLVIAVPLGNAATPWFGARAELPVAPARAPGGAVRALDAGALAIELGFGLEALVDPATLAAALLRYFGCYVRPVAAMAPRTVREVLASLACPAGSVVSASALVARLLASLDNPPHEVNQVRFTARACHQPRRFAAMIMVGEVVRADPRTLWIRGRQFQLTGATGAERYVAISPVAGEHALARAKWRLDTYPVHGADALRRAIDAEVIDPWTWSSASGQADAGGTITPSRPARKATSPSERRPVLERLES